MRYDATICAGLDGSSRTTWSLPRPDCSGPQGMTDKPTPDAARAPRCGSALRPVWRSLPHHPRTNSRPRFDDIGGDGSGPRIPIGDVPYDWTRTAWPRPVYQTRAHVNPRGLTTLPSS